MILKGNQMLENIDGAKLKSMTIEQLSALCEELREKLSAL